MELEIGMYVRTINGKIWIIKSQKAISGHKKDIINASYNIIDLIEVGDYVNGYKVLFAGATTWDNNGNVIDKRVKINYDGYDRWLSEDFIKSIVTKEQFSSMEYKIER